jgi:hypothetical protein
MVGGGGWRVLGGDFNAGARRLGFRGVRRVRCLAHGGALVSFFPGLGLGF